jgi:hypothetical protein
LVETREPTAVGAESVSLHGELVDSLGDTDLSFVVEASNGTEVKTTTVETGVDSPQAFNTTVEGLEPDTEYVYYARAVESGGTTRITGTGKAVRFTTDEPEIETVDVRTTGASSIEVDGNLTNIAELDEINLSIRYREQRSVDFTGNSDDDEIIGHGGFQTGPDGHAHGTRFINDNTPLYPGTNRTYEYFAQSTETNSLLGTLRDGPSDDTYFPDEINGISDVETVTTDIPLHTRFEVTVEYTDDGEEVRVYVDGEHEHTWDAGSIADYNELYFSSAEGAGPDDDKKSLRVVSAPTFGEPQTEYVDTATAAPTPYTGELAGIQPDTVYALEAYTERTINGRTINATGEIQTNQTEPLVETREPTAVGAESVQLEGSLKGSLGDADLSFVVEAADGTEVKNTTVETGVDSSQAFNTTVEGLKSDTEYVYYARAVESGGTTRIISTGDGVRFTTDEPEIETVDVRTTGASSIEVDGNLTNIAELDEINLSIRYREQRPVDFTGNSDDDEILGHGGFQTGPDGHAHGTRFVNDNTPLYPGTNRTYEYLAQSTETNSLLGTLRDEPSDDTYFPDEINGISDVETVTTDIPLNTRFDVTVEYTDDGEEVRVYVDGEHEHTWDAGSIADYDELYFSSAEGAGPDDDAKSLRVVSAPTFGEPQTEYVDTTTTAPTPYTGELAGIQPDTVYALEAYTERTINGRTINATGEIQTNQTEPLVETREPTDVGAESVQLEGSLKGSLGDADLSFVVEAADGTELRNTTVETGVDSPQAFNTTVEGLEPNTDYVYYARAVESGGSTRITGTGDEVAFTTDEPEVETDDVTSTGSDRIEVDGTLTNIAELDEMNLGIRYREQRSVNFTGDSDDDEIISEGGFQTGPDGYAHNTWLHDNTPLYPGTNRTYEYLLQSSETDRFVGTLRDAPTDDTSNGNGMDGISGFVDLIDDVSSLPQNEPFELTVEYTDDGEEVRVYIEGEHRQTWDAAAIGSHHELYFTTGEGGSVSDAESLRVISAPTFGEPQTEYIETATFAPDSYTGELTGLQPGTVYVVEAYAEREVNGRTINATGKTLANATDP